MDGREAVITEKNVFFVLDRWMNGWIELKRITS